MIVVIPILCSIILLVSLYIAYRNERKAFNGGKCPKCNGKLKYVYKDDEDRKHYRCPHCGYEVVTIIFNENWYR